MARFASEEVKAELIKVANQLIENGKGLLAADEGHPVVGARLEKVRYWFHSKAALILPSLFFWNYYLRLASNQMKKTVSDLEI